jgi:MFS family permease
MSGWSMNGMGRRGPGSYLGLYCALMLTTCVASAGITVIYNDLPTLQRVFPGQPALAWVVTVYWLFSAVAAAVCGRYGDAIGRRRMMCIVLVLCACGALVSANAHSLWMLIAGCAVQSVASAITPLAFGLFRENLPPARMPIAVGVLTAAGTVAAGIIYVGSGVVIDDYSWQAGFYLKVALAAVALAAVLTLVPHSTPAPQQRFNWLYGILFAPALAALLVTVQQIREWGLADPRLWSLLAAGFGLMVVWARHELRAAQPFVDLRVLRDPQIRLANIGIILLVLGAVQIGQVFTLLFQQPAWTGVGFGLSATHSGSMHLLLDLVAVIAAPWSGKIAARHGARRSALIGFAIITLSWGSLVFVHPPLAPTVSIAAVTLAGYSITACGLYNLIIESTPTQRTSEAMGFTYVLFTAFFAVGAQIIFALLRTSRIVEPLHGIVDFPSQAAFSLSFGYIALTGLVGVGVALRLPNRQPLELLEAAVL